MALQCEISELQEKRECRACGIFFSPVPEDDREQFLRDLYSKATQSWVDGEIGVLKQRSVHVRKTTVPA